MKNTNLSVRHKLMLSVVFGSVLLISLTCGLHFGLKKGSAKVDESSNSEKMSSKSPNHAALGSTMVDESSKGVESQIANEETATSLNQPTPSAPKKSVVYKTLAELEDLRHNRRVQIYPFYTKGEPGYYLTNFYIAAITVSGIAYPSSEHYFQAMKFTDPKISEQIRTAPTPRAAFNIAQANKALTRSNWLIEANKYMKIGLRAKFDQHPDLKKQLLETENTYLVEASPFDSFWGAGVASIGNDQTYPGENKLGKFLMELRYEYGTQ